MRSTRDNAGHFDADKVCSIALLKNGPTHSHVDMQIVGANNLSAWVDNEELNKELDEIIEGRPAGVTN